MRPKKNKSQSEHVYSFESNFKTANAIHWKIAAQKKGERKNALQ